MILPAQLVDLAAVEEQLPLALGLVAELAGGGVRADVRVQQEELVAGKRA